MNKIILLIPTMLLLAACSQPPSAPSEGDIQTAIAQTQVAQPTVSPTIQPPTAEPTHTPAPTETSLPTSTTAPTSTSTIVSKPTSSPTTIPTSTPQPVITQASGTKADPVPYGEAYQIPGFGTLRIDDRQLEPGQTGVAVVHLVLECTRPSDQSCDTLDLFFDAIGGSGAAYEQEFSSSVPEPDFWLREVFGGGRLEGYEGFLVTNPEEELLLRVAYGFDTEIFFVIF